MERDARAYLWDALENARAIERFIAGKSLQDYLDDEILRSAVERRFEIVGESLGRLAKTDAALASQITDLVRAVAFRNLLIHGYAMIDDGVVWRTATEDAPHLRAEREAAFEGLGSADRSA